MRCVGFNDIEVITFDFGSIEKLIVKLRSLAEMKGEGILFITKYKEKPSLAEQVKIYIDEHFCELRNIKDLADVLGYRVEYIIKCFKMAYGITPGKYMIELKKAYAKILYKYGKRLKQIASEIQRSVSSISRWLCTVF